MNWPADQSNKRLIDFDWMTYYSIKGQPAERLIDRLITKLTNRPDYFNRPTSWLTNHPIRSTNQLTDQPTDPIDRPIRSIDQPTDWPTTDRSNQPSDPIGRPTNRPIRSVTTNLLLGQLLHVVFSSSERFNQFRFLRADGPKRKA